MQAAMRDMLDSAGLQRVKILAKVKHPLSHPSSELRGMPLQILTFPVFWVRNFSSPPALHGLHSPTIRLCTLQPQFLLLRLAGGESAGADHFAAIAAAATA